MWDNIQFVTTPLALIAFVVAVGAQVYRSRLGTMQKTIEAAKEEDRAQLVLAALDTYQIRHDNLTREQKFALMGQVIRERGHRFRVLALVSVLIFLGSLGCIVTLALLEHKEPKIGRVKLFDEQIAVLKEVVELIGGRPGGDLEAEFGLFQTINDNTRFLLDGYATVALGSPKTDLRELVPSGSEMLVLEDTPRSGAGLIEFNPSNKIVRLRALILPPSYVAKRNRIQKLIESPLMPEDIKQTLVEFQGDLRADVLLIGSVLNDCAQAFPVRYPSRQSLVSTHPDSVFSVPSNQWIMMRYVSVMHPLKADSVMGVLRRYWRIDELRP